jgi:predicted N-acetyltransferase YhbS
VDARLVARELAPAGFGALATIDRSERIDGHYVLDGDALRFVSAPVEVAGWSPGHADELVARLHEVHAAGGAVVGAWDGDALVGLAALDVRLVGGDPHVMDLAVVHVGRAHRGQGVAKHLIAVLAARATALGATALYISATPTRNTVDAYVRVGARLAAPPDPELLAREPDDIHLLLPL